MVARASRCGHEPEVGKSARAIEAWSEQSASCSNRCVHFWPASGARAPDGEFVVLDREVSVSSTSIPAARYSRSRGRTRVGRPALPNGVRAPSAARPPTRGRVEGGSAVPLPVKRPPRRQGS